MKSFKEMYDFAAKKKGGKAALEALMPKTKKAAALKKVSDDRYLAQITKSVFQAGFIWRVVEHKWEGFEEAFQNFDIKKNAKLSSVEMGKLLKDERIIRNRMKILTVPENAKMIQDIAKEHGSFGAFLASWPEDDFVGLLDYLKTHGSRIGGMTGQYSLRFLGKDGFMLSRDGEKELKKQRIFTGTSTTKRSQKQIQEAYNKWRGESGKSYAEISRIVAMQVN